MNPFITYHLHSDYSLLDSCTKFQDYVELAKANGQPAIASTEHGKPLGWVSKKLYCDEAGIRFIHGVEIYLTESLEEKVRDNYHTILLARNLDGVLELNRLVSKSCDKDHFYYQNRISFDEFLDISDNIISTSACLASPLNKLSDDHPRYMELAQKYTFLEIQPHDHPDQYAFNRRLLALSQRLGKKLIVGTDTHSSSKYKAECRATLLMAKHKNYGDEDAFDLTYKTYDELMEMFRKQGALSESEYQEALDNTNLLYDLTEDFELDKAIKYPILYGSREADSEKFTETVERKFAEKLSTGIIPKKQEAAFRDAINEEMRVFQKLKMDGFMLSMSELISWCKAHNMAIGTARGSVGGSRVAYVADIIDLNPETWHTVFSRFCNEDRVEIGDIDIDCVESDRPAIFQYIIQRFGINKTARVASFGTLQAKGVVDEVGRAKMFEWNLAHDRKFDDKSPDNPFGYKFIDKVKAEMTADLDAAKQKYPEIFYYFDGMMDIKVSQSVHPAGMIISPVSLDDNYGMFDKDNENCLMLDMDEAHEVGLAKYDFLVLRNVQIIRDTCSYLGRPYPKTHEIDWNDAAVWDDMIRSPTGIFQFESAFAFDSLKKFLPKSIFDMSLVTACIRPSGASYRDDLLSHRKHANPSEIIDDLLKDNLGYLIYQEDTIKFLQQICGLSGSEADNIRRAIGRKQKDRLDAAMPSILEGYCSKSSQPREVAEEEAKEFLQIIEDSASYQFGYNHSIAYCLLGYLCAYFRHYHPLEFLTAFLNDAANDDDIKNGTAYADQIGIQITAPRFGASKDIYYFNTEHRTIAKGLASVKYMSASVANDLYEISKLDLGGSFVDLWRYVKEHTAIDSRQIDSLIKIDYFSQFGNNAELLRMVNIIDFFNGGKAKSIKKDKLDPTMEQFVAAHGTDKGVKGNELKSYTITDMDGLLHDLEAYVKSLHLPELPYRVKAQNQKDILGYVDLTTHLEQDRRKLYILDVRPLKSKFTGKTWSYLTNTKSVGSGRTSRLFIKPWIFEKAQFAEGDLIYARHLQKEVNKAGAEYWWLHDYDIVPG